MRPFNNLEDETPSDTYWRVWLVGKLRLTNHGAFDESRFIMTLLTIFEVTIILLF